MGDYYRRRFSARANQNKLAQCAEMNALDLTLEQKLPLEIERWRSCTAFHSQKWVEFCERNLNLTVEHAVIRNGPEVVAYVPVISAAAKHSHKRCGPALSGSVPQLIFSDEFNERVNAINASLADAALSALVLSDSETSSTSAFSLDMNGTFEDYWSNRVSAKAKYDVRKSERESLTTEYLDTDRLNAFYPLYLRRMQELGSPGFGLQLFRGMADVFGEELQFVITKKDDQIVAASTLFTHAGRWMAHPWSVSHSGFRSASVNYGHYRDIIRYGFDNGYTIFSMGPSLRNSPWCRIKQRFGAIEHSVIRTDGLPLIHASQRLPVRLLGPLIKRCPPALYRLYAPWLANLALKHMR